MLSVTRDKQATKMLGLQLRSALARLPASAPGHLRENEPTIRGATRMLYRYSSPLTQSVIRTEMAKEDASSTSNLNWREISKNRQAPRNRVTVDCFWAQHP